MAIFELERRNARITSVINRAECHGDEDVPAVSVKLELALSADDLAMFGSQLRASLYENRGNGHAGDLAEEGAPLRNPVIDPPISLSWEGIGYEVEIERGLGLTDVVRIPAAIIDKVSIDPRQGGTVETVLMVRSSEVTETDRGRLTSLLKHVVTVTARPPLPDTTGPAEKKSRRKRKDAQLELDEARATA